MGYNTVMLVTNDNMDMFAKDSYFGSKLVSTILKSRENDNTTQWGPYNTVVLPSIHADYIQVVAAGMNGLKRIGFSSKTSPEEIIIDLAEQMGYTVKKKRTKQTE